MPERKSRWLWATAIVAIVAIFACGGVWAAGPCMSPATANLPPGECVNLWGYDVKVDRTQDSSGLFPYYLGNDSVYSWSLTPFNAKYAVGHIDLKIPVSLGSSITGGNVEVIINECFLTYSDPPTSNPGSWMMYPPGKGDSSTYFGAYEFDYQVLKFIPANFTGCLIKNNNTSTLKVIFKDKELFSGLDSFLIKAATKGGSGEAMDLLGPSFISRSTDLANQPPLRSVESFKLGDQNCAMVVTLNSDGLIANAFVRPFVDDDSGCPVGPLTIEPISRTFICDKDVNGAPINCKPKKFVEQNIIDKSGIDSTYCYYTTTGQRVCKTF